MASTSASKSQNSPRKTRIIVAATGCVSAMKFNHLCRSFAKWGDVIAVLTQKAKPFIDTKMMPPDVKFFTDDCFWNAQKFSDWADILVIAPLSANTLAKIANGLSDNLLTSIVRAWNYDKPIFAAPAMNALMWKNPFTNMHLKAVDELGIKMIVPDTRWHTVGVVAETHEIEGEVRLAYEQMKVRF